MNLYYNEINLYINVKVIYIKVFKFIKFIIFDLGLKIYIFFFPLILNTFLS